MAVDAFSWLLKLHTNFFDFGSPSPPYVVVLLKDKTDRHDMNGQDLLTIQKVVAVPRENAHSRIVVKEANAPTFFTNPTK